MRGNESLQTILYVARKINLYSVVIGLLFVGMEVNGGDVYSYANVGNM